MFSRFGEDFEEKLAQVHLKLYHLMLDSETSDEEASLCARILASFDKEWKVYTDQENKDDNAQLGT